MLGGSSPLGCHGGSSLGLPTGPFEPLVAFAFSFLCSSGSSTFSGTVPKYPPAPGPWLSPGSATAHRQIVIQKAVLMLMWFAPPPPQDGAVTPTQGAAGDWASPTTHSGTPCNCLSVGEAPASSLPTALHQDGAWSSAAASWQPPRVWGKSENTAGDWDAAPALWLRSSVVKAQGFWGKAGAGCCPRPGQRVWGWQPASPVDESWEPAAKSARQRG